MIEDGVTQVTDGVELWTQVAERLKELVDKHKHVYPLESGTFMPPQFAAVTLLSELLDNGVLVREGSDLRFMHESVQEYFAAVALRDCPVENLTARAPVLNLARPDARGPMFETLVTWTGLVPSERVAELAGRLGVSHPLLAAHMCREALLSGQIMEEAQRGFLTMTESEHEARVRLGFMGLVLVVLDDPAVVERLVAALERNSPARDVARNALKSRPTVHTIRALVKACLASSEPTGTSAARALRDSTKAEPRCVAAALVEAWRLPDADADAVTGLGAHVDTDWLDERQGVAEALVSLSADAELEDDLELSRAIDALKDRMDKADRPIGFDWSAIERNERQRETREAQLEVFAETCKGQGIRD